MKKKKKRLDRVDLKKQTLDMKEKWMRVSSERIRKFGEWENIARIVN